MDIWIIRDGEKVGPIHDFEVRKKIESGELAPTTPAWHEGLGEWRPLAKIELFTREFELLEKPQPNKETEDKFDKLITSPPLPPPPTSHYIRRFWARWFDLQLYAGIWWIAMWGAGQNIEAALTNQWILFFQFVPWFVLEAFLIYKFRTTPGKWFLGIKVLNKDGTPLDLSASTRRSLRVMFTGVGFAYQPLALFCQALSLFTAKRLGEALWDYVGSHKLETAPLRPARVISLVILFFGALQLQSIVVSPYYMKAALEAFPNWKDAIKENPPYHLPERS